MNIRFKNIGQLLMLLVMMALPLSLWAQGNVDSEYNKASRLYYFGKFDEARESLLSIINTLPAYQQLQAYRMMASMALYDDDLSECEQYVAQMLQLDPYYNDSSDDPRLMDIVNNMKRRSNTLSTASSQSESLEEAPVPVTVISQEMIRALGPRSLQDILAQYVPGMNIVDGLESNIAMRGIYGQNQEVIYLLQDGHRLNSQLTNSGALDYRNSLDKIKQIEVLRGPASSLYGNAALTSVVNIITQDGIAFDGNEASVNVGSFGSYGASFTRGKGSINTDFLLWGSFYTSRGEKVLHDGYATNVKWAPDGYNVTNTLDPYQSVRYVGGYNHKPTFDVGMKLRWDDFTANISYQQGKRVAYNNIFSLGDTYSYDSYAESEGYKPGLTRSNLRASLDYNHSWKKWFVRAGVSVDMERGCLYNVLADSLSDYASNIIEIALKDPDRFRTIMEEFVIAYRKHKIDPEDQENNAKIDAMAAELFPDTVPRAYGTYEPLRWSNTTYSGSASVGYNYGKRDGAHGSLLFGMQFEYFHCDYGRMDFGNQFNNVFASYEEILNLKDEYTISTFSQWKHNFNRHSILNLGLRYDGKHRYDGEFLNNFSPRLSFIWLPNKYSSLKACYAHSFVDASFFNRSSRVAIYHGEDLKPEQMDAFQLDYMVRWNNAHLRYEANLFYNIVSDLVYFNHNGDAVKTGGFQNTGKVKMIGLEQVLSYNVPSTHINVNTTFQKPIQNEGFVGTQHQVCNVPDFILNATLAQRVFTTRSYGSLWANVSGRLVSAIALKRVNIIDSMFLNATAAAIDSGVVQINRDFSQPGKFTMNLGLRYDWRNLSASVHCYNLWNTSYVNGGLFYSPEPAQSRSVVGKFSVKF